MGIVVNPLRRRLGCGVFWHSVIPYWGNNDAFQFHRFMVYIVGIFLWIFRFIHRISRRRMRFYITDWSCGIQSFEGDVVSIYFEIFDYGNYRRLVKKVAYDRWLRKNVNVLNHYETALKEHDEETAMRVQIAINRAYSLIRKRIVLARFHGSFYTYNRLMFYMLRKKIAQLSKLYGFRRVVVRLLQMTPIRRTTAYLIGAWCLRKVDEGFKPYQILSRAVAGCKNLQCLEGFKICVTGRFTRRQASTFSWLAGGQSGVGFFADKTQFATVTGVSQYGSCSIKIWLRYV